MEKYLILFALAGVTLVSRAQNPPVHSEDVAHKPGTSDTTCDWVIARIGQLVYKANTTAH